jgi:1-phosphofructokinase
MSAVCVFAPGVLVTVTVEDHPTGEELHFHAGGQGTWVARMAHRLGARSILCTALGGEAGAVARALLDREGIEVRVVPHEADTPAYVHDRRSGERDPLIETDPTPLGRHTLDELYSVTLGEAIDSGVCVLTGAGAGPGADDALPPRTYERLAHDLRATGSAVLADLHGAPAAAALDGGLDLLKISSEEIEADGLVPESASEAQLVEAARGLQARGAVDVVVSRAAEGTLAVFGDDAYRAVSPRLAAVDTRGAGDSMTAALAVARSDAMAPEATLRFASAAGSLNVTRHGLATGFRPTIDRLAEKVEVSRVE